VLGFFKTLSEAFFYKAPIIPPTLGSSFGASIFDFAFIKFLIGFIAGKAGN
jgi:hypothetical protein